MENAPECRLRKKHRRISKEERSVLSNYSSCFELAQKIRLPAPKHGFAKEDNGCWLKYLALKDAVIPRLPVRMRFQMRAVSAAFASDSASSYGETEELWFIMNRSFGTAILSAVPSPPWDIVLFSNKENAFFRIPALNPSHRSHSNLVSLLGQPVHGDGENSGKILFSLSMDKPGMFQPSISSAGGIICACVKNPNFKPPVVRDSDSESESDLDSDSDYTKADHLSDFKVILFNPLTGSVKQLAVADGWDNFFCYTRGTVSPRMAMAKNGRDYYILLSRICLERGKHRNVYQLYDSSKECWRFCEPPSSAIPDFTKLLSCDFFYLICSRGGDRKITQFMVHGYLAAEDKWFKTILTSQKDRLLFHHWPIRDIIFFDGSVLKHNSRLLMIVTCTNREHESIASPDTVVLELVPISSEVSTVMEVSRMPKHLNHLSMGLQLIPRAINTGSVFCVTFFPINPHINVTDHTYVVVYDVSKDLWYPILAPNASDGDEAMLYTCIAVVNPFIAMGNPNVP